MLNIGELENLVGGTWQLDCQSIALHSRSPDIPRITAPGWIKHDENGDLNFKLVGAGSWNAVARSSQKVAGQLLGAEELYDLEAVDEFHRVWVSEQVHISSVDSSLRGSMASLARERAFPTQTERLHLTLPQAIKIPCNTLTEKTTLVGESVTRRENTWNVAQLDSLGHRFRLTSTESTLQLDIESKEGALHPKIELLATDALAFSLARPFPWVVAERFSNGMDRVEIRPRRLELKAGRRMLPYDRLLGHQNAGIVWAIWDRYLAYTSKYVGEGRHPLSIHVRDVLDSAIATVDAHALTLCVAIEGVISREFNDLAKRAESAPSIEQAINRARAALERENLDPHFVKRINGLFETMKKPHPRTKDVFARLVKNGVITDAQMKDWGTLRNPSAHGGRFTDVPRQEFIDLLFRVMVLFHHLVFAVIGYSGEYTDYGTYGWPTRSYGTGVSSGTPSPTEIP